MLKKLVGLVLVAVFTLSAGYALAETNAQAETFNVCVSPGGSLKLAEPDGSCLTGEPRSLRNWQGSQLNDTLYSRNATHEVLPVEAERNFTVLCDAGDKVTGGGYRLNTSLASVRVLSQNQLLDLSGWQVGVFNSSGSTTQVEVFAVCQDLP